MLLYGKSLSLSTLHQASGGGGCWAGSRRALGSQPQATQAGGYARSPVFDPKRRAASLQWHRACSSCMQLLAACGSTHFKNSWPTAPLAPTMLMAGPLSTLAARTTRRDGREHRARGAALKLLVLERVCMMIGNTDADARRGWVIEQTTAEPDPGGGTRGGG